MTTIDPVAKISPPRLPILAGFFVGLSAAIAASASVERPNILFIISDDAGFTDFGFQAPVTGEESAVPTPNLDSLAEQGVHFTKSYPFAKYGELTGKFAQVDGLPEGYTIDYAYGPSGDQIAIRARAPF